MYLSEWTVIDLLYVSTLAMKLSTAPEENIGMSIAG